MDLPKMIHSGYWRGGHCQGIAVDTQRRYMYFSFTTMLIKTDLQGNFIGSVTGLLGHLGCLAFNHDDGMLYGSLEYKMDAIGKDILQKAGVADKQLADAFYIVRFDGEKIDRPNMDASLNGVMTAVHLQEVLDDYKAEVTADGAILQHRHGCSGIDGVTFAPVPGSSNEQKMLFVAYGVYGDVSRTDNDYQVLLCYDTSDWDRYAMPLLQDDMHRHGPEKPLHKYFVFTGNTTYGVQNLEYDPYTGDLLMAVYPGKKETYPNYALFAVNVKQAACTAILEGVEPAMQGEILPLRREGWYFQHGSTGLCALGEGQYYISHHGTDEAGYCAQVHLYRWDERTPFVKV